METWRIGPIIWGAMLIWIGVMKIVDEPAGLASIGAGSILLLGALWRRSMGRRAGFVLTAMGILLLAMGLRDTVTGGKDIPLFATALIAIGALIVTKGIAISRAVRSTSMRLSGRARPTTTRHYDFDADDER